MVALKFILLLALAQGAFITPHQYYDPARKLFLTSGGTNWDFFAPDDSTSKTTTRDKNLQFVARSRFVVEDGLQPTLTLRLDQGNWKSARSYGERWLKDFPKFGYELQMSRDTSIGSLKGFEMELTSKKTAHVFHQLVVKNGQEFLVFTCSTDQRHLKTSWQACEKIIKTAHLKR